MWRHRCQAWFAAHVTLKHFCLHCSVLYVSICKLYSNSDTILEIDNSMTPWVRNNKRIAGLLSALTEGVECIGWCTFRLLQPKKEHNEKQNQKYSICGHITCRTGHAAWAQQQQQWQQIWLPETLQQHPCGAAWKEKKTTNLGSRFHRKSSSSSPPAKIYHCIHLSIMQTK